MCVYGVRVGDSLFALCFISLLFSLWLSNIHFWKIALFNIFDHCSTPKLLPQRDWGKSHHTQPLKPFCCCWLTEYLSAQGRTCHWAQLLTIDIAVVGIGVLKGNSLMVKGPYSALPFLHRSHLISWGEESFLWGRHIYSLFCSLLPFSFFPMFSYL